MLYTLTKTNKNKEVRKYKVEYTITYCNTFSKKDKEKAYRIERIIDSLGEDNIDEISDKDYRFQTDDDNGEHILDGVVKKDGQVDDPHSIVSHTTTRDI